MCVQYDLENTQLILWLWDIHKTTTHWHLKQTTIHSIYRADTKINDAQSPVVLCNVTKGATWAAGSSGRKHREAVTRCLPWFWQLKQFSRESAHFPLSPLLHNRTLCLTKWLLHHWHRSSLLCVCFTESTAHSLQADHSTRPPSHSPLLGDSWRQLPLMCPQAWF